MKIKNTELKATVLIANYNNAKYIDRCVNSVITQSYKKLEIIFIDDSSTDDSLKVIKKYSKKIKVIKKNNKLGVGCFDQIETYHEGFKKSKGKIIFLLDSDDFFKREKVTILMNEFNKNKKNNILYDLPIKKFSKKKNLFIKKKNKLIKNYWPYFAPTSCISFRRNKFKKIFSLINFRSYSDIWLDFRIGIVSIYIFKQYNFIEKNLTFYRQSENNISSGFKHISINWWRRRMQAHHFVKFFFLKHKIFYKKNLDYYVTYFINLLIR
jgi:glycosyltransferase involved in cell wall biosynthesis